MPKPKKVRKVELPPAITYFKPQGIPLAQLQQIVLNVDEYEALRLVDYEKMDQAAAAERLEISRATCARIVADAHGKIAEAITLGKAIKIEGGNFKLVNNLLRCKDCGTSWRVQRKNSRGIARKKENVACPECDSSNATDLGKALSR